jgi:outer membrane protein assembly factor BamE (lipoprotein component of BamABCDE complex)
MLRAKWMVLVAVAAVLLGACSPNKATVDNYKTLDWTMTRDQVYSVLGHPSEAIKRETDPSGNTTIETWNGKDQDLITITFVNNKLVMKSMRSNGVDY